MGRRGTTPGRSGGSHRGHRGDPAARQGATALPDLATLTDVPAFSELAMSDDQSAAFEEACRALGAEGIDASELEPACVVRLDRSFPALASARGLLRAEFSFRFGVVREPSAVVGDWVVLRRPSGHDLGIIERVLPRASELARWRGGARGTRQVLAANVDRVVVVQALGGRGLDANQLARAVVVAADCGCDAAVVLSKADRSAAGSAGADASAAREVLGPGVPVVVSSSETGEGVERVRALVPAGTVALVLGESGAGKSSLLNALLGSRTLATGAVRASDDRGRHTTVARRMVSVPGGGVVVDAPGLRSLPLMGHERGLDLVFPEVAQAALECRFADCTHTHEPGCAVRALVERGSLAPERLGAYVALAAEMRAAARSLDPDVAR